MEYKTYVLHQLREMKRELLDAIDGLSEDDMRSHDPAGHWPVAWIAEHCTQVADDVLHARRHGKMMLDYIPAVLDWSEQDPVPGAAYPPRDEIASRWISVCDSIVGIIEGLGDAEFAAESGSGTKRQPSWAEKCLMVVNHTNVHLRSLWCVLGERRVDTKFPEQKAWLA